MSGAGRGKRVSQGRVTCRKLKGCRLADRRLSPLPPCHSGQGGGPSVQPGASYHELTDSPSQASVQLSFLGEDFPAPHSLSQSPLYLLHFTCLLQTEFPEGRGLCLCVPVAPPAEVCLSLAGQRASVGRGDKSERDAEPS